MVGRNLTEIYPYEPRHQGNIVLNVEEYSVQHKGTVKNDYR